MPFHGKYSEYTTFREMFRSLIENDPTLGDVEKLHYLRSFLKGESFDIVKNLPLIGASFIEAVKLLDERYNNKYKIVNEHISHLLDLSIITKPSPANIRQFVSSIKQTLAALKNLGAKVDEWNPILMCIFTRKIDTQSSHAYQLERDAKEDPTVTQFLGFLEKRALAMENAGSPSTTTKAINAVTREKRGCIYCAASGGGEQRDAELCCLRSLRGPAAAHAVSASPAAVV
ncbi:uncharacterized protein LOC126373073 isoform X2 [Pectinophora gossypiella]|uniref:uncharacterized protein LOC126373073 isoform X2 n=1 Tax=Pectinophora gossypiella TaxID=13191 RepID=UPI00214F2D51|nr:uncharacterized protein LOC126373073 isoform X2 [Pectinophora gossypiella]